MLLAQQPWVFNLVNEMHFENGRRSDSERAIRKLRRRGGDWQTSQRVELQRQANWEVWKDDCVMRAAEEAANGGNSGQQY